MKFTEGYWEKNERANALYAVQAGYAEKIAAGMRVIANQSWEERMNWMSVQW